MESKASSAGNHFGEDTQGGRENNQIPALILNNLPTNTCIIDEKGIITDINEYLISQIGGGTGKKEDYLGKSLLKHPSVVAAGLSQVYAGLLKGIPFELTEQRFPFTTGGSEKWMNVKGQPLMKEGRVTGALLVHEDVTERKRYKDKMQLSNDILTDVGTLVLVADSKGSVVYCAPSVHRMLGYTVEEVMGHRWWELTFSSNKEKKIRKKAFVKRFSNTSAGQNEEIVRKVLCNDGTEKWVAWNNVKASNGQVIAVGHDITARILIERELQKRNKELETLFYRISHDLRGPTATIKGLTSLMAEEENRSQRKEYIKLTEESTALMDSMLYDLRDVSLVYDRSLTMADIDLNADIEEVMSVIMRMVDAADVIFKTDITVAGPFHSDRMLLLSLFKNLLENAVKYRKKQTVRGRKEPHRVSLTVANHKKDSIVITVSDNGTGMTKTIQKKVFGMFYRGTNDVKGTGLGLYLVRNIVDLLGGTIELNSRLRLGTVITVILPRSSPH